MERSGGLALLGSGELADAMAEVHRTIMAGIDGPVRPVFVDALAGFEPNVDQIDEKARAYFARNFGLDLAVARYRSGRENAASIADALTAIQQATYILAGPGSPSYGIRVLRESPVWQAMVARWHAGATLVFASAAAITVGEFALPVYEIYKAGHEVGWMDGLNLLGELGLRTAVVPHWNNASGAHHDTRYCYMGAARLATLEQMLPPDVLIVGVDEYTGLCLGGTDRHARVLGTAGVTIRRAGQQAVWQAGQSFDLDDALRTAVPDRTPTRETTLPTVTVESDESSGEIDQLRATIREAAARGDGHAVARGLVALGVIAGTGVEQGLSDRTEDAVQALQATLPLVSTVIPDAGSAEAQDAARRTLLDLLVAARAQLRQQGQWAFADEVRDNLDRLGYVLADTPDGTTWQERAAQGATAGAS